jgi:hypothetical protein
MFSLAAPPAAWSAQTIAGYAISSQACYPADMLRTKPTFTGMWDLLVVISLSALIVGVLGAGIAYRNWSSTRYERGGAGPELIERGEGRTRFLAMCGLIVAGGFSVATAFSMVALILSPLCK